MFKSEGVSASLLAPYISLTKAKPYVKTLHSFESTGQLPKPYHSGRHGALAGGDLAIMPSVQGRDVLLEATVQGRCGEGQ